MAHRKFQAITVDKREPVKFWVINGSITSGPTSENSFTKFSIITMHKELWLKYPGHVFVGIWFFLPVHQK